MPTPQVRELATPYLPVRAKTGETSAFAPGPSGDRWAMAHQSHRRLRLLATKIPRRLIALLLA